MDDGAIIRIRRHGKPDGLRIVLSHGNGFAAEAYYPFWAELLDRCDVVLFDFRNHGQNSFHSADAHQYARMVADLGPVRGAIDDAFGARPALSVFHSLSARANMKRALDDGWLWEAMVLFDPPMVPPPVSTTWAPSSAAVMAAENPADPAPITARSYWLSVSNVVTFSFHFLFALGYSGRRANAPGGRGA